MSSISISQGHCELYECLHSVPPSSPEAPPFSPITPERSYSSVAPDSSALLMSDDSLLSMPTTSLAAPSLPSSAVVQDTATGDTSSADPTLEPTSVNPCIPSVSSPLPLAASSPKTSKRSMWPGFKIVIDNLDMNLRPRHQTFERQTKSIHYVNCYAVRDRIDLSRFSASAHSEQKEVSFASILPSDDDRKAIMDNFVLLAGRILCESIPQLQEIPHLATQHILHEHSNEMGCKSEIVCKPKHISTCRE